MNNALITALATPFKNGKIDCKSYEKLVGFQVENGADALLVGSTTAEGPLLDVCEKKLLFSLTKGIATKTPIIAGVGGYSTKQVVDEATYLAKLGAEGILVSPPSFSKCTAEGFTRHISAIMQAVDVPVILYNVPSRCGYQLDADAVLKLNGMGVAAIKDAGGDLHYTKLLADRMPVLCGNDEKLPEMLAVGAKGVISVASNVNPVLTRAVLDGDGNAYDEFCELARLTMLEVNPICVKYMLYKMGIFDTFDMRLPLTPACEKTRAAIDERWKV